MPFEAVHDRKAIIDKTKQGLRPREIATLLGMTSNQVSQVLYYVRKSPNYKHKASELRKILRHENLKNGKTAVDALKDVAELDAKKQPAVAMAKVRAASEILDRAGVQSEVSKATIVNVNLGVLNW